MCASQMSPVYKSAIDFVNPSVRLYIFHPRFHFIGFHQCFILLVISSLVSVADMLSACPVSFVPHAYLISMLCVVIPGISEPSELSW